MESDPKRIVSTQVAANALPMVGLTGRTANGYSFHRTHLTTMTPRLTTLTRTHRVRPVAKAQPACGRFGRPSRDRVTPLPNAVSADRMRGA